MPSLSKTFQNANAEERYRIMGNWMSHPEPGEEVVITGKDI